MRPNAKPIPPSIVSTNPTSIAGDTFFNDTFDDEVMSTTTTQIMPFPAATYVDPRASVQTFQSMNTIDLAVAKSKAIKEYKNTPQFQQFAGEINRRDAELARLGLRIEVSKEPQRIYEREQMMKKVKKYGKIGCIVFLVVFLIVLPVSLTASGKKNNEESGKTVKDSPTISPSLIPTALPTFSPVPFPTSLPTESPTVFLRLSQEEMRNFCADQPCLDHFIFDEENEQYEVVTTGTPTASRLRITESASDLRVTLLDENLCNNRFDNLVANCPEDLDGDDFCCPVVT
eukprot:snap_masked-scaffold_8-processed-gene-14.65-mRNA-1 protein AED:1.00 eAED:1.00 QI:0/0/0/0/1/1/2/0/286